MDHLHFTNLSAIGFAQKWLTDGHKLGRNLNILRRQDVNLAVEEAAKFNRYQEVLKLELVHSVLVGQLMVHHHSSR
jgi:hypothetical protein